MIMPELQIIDDLLAPKDTIIVRFQGKNPVESALMVPRMLVEIMKVSSKDVLETDIKWDISGPIPAFYGRWLGKRKEDAWTATNIRIIIQGEQDPKEHIGWARIELKGIINTRYQYSNFIQRTFWWFYSLLFYNKQRRGYIEEGKDMIYEMRDLFQRRLGIEQQ